MALTLTWNQDQQQYLLQGTARDSSTSVPIGRKYFTYPPPPSSGDPKPPVFVIGFDDNFSGPVIVRAFYDPTADTEIYASLASKAVLVGFVQTMQIKFRGTLSIPPARFGGMLAGREAYQFGAENEFIDFMSPADAKLRNVTLPLYAYNSMLMDDSTLWLPAADTLPSGDLRSSTLAANLGFFAAGLANGSLYTSTDFSSELGTFKPQSTVASIAAEINPSLTTPADVAGWLDDNHLLVEYPITFLLQEPYEYALFQLRNVPLPGDDTPFLAGVTNADIAGAAIGEYVLLTLPEDDDDDETTLIVATKKDSGGSLTAVRVYSLDADEMAAMTGNQARELLWRVKNYQLKTGRKADTDEAMTDGTSGARGFSGLLVPPFDLDPDKPVFELTYRAIPVGYHLAVDQERNEYLRAAPHRGIKWSALLSYSAVDNQLSVAAVGEPERLRSYKTLAALAAFDKALESSAPGQLIDLSNFTKAAMSRDNFGSGVKLTFLTASGTEITS